MKKLVFLICAICALSSCSTIRNSATHKAVSVQPISALTADIEVYSPRVTYTMKPDRKVRRGGLENVKSTAVREALQQNGNGDVLVGLEVQTKSRRFLVWNRVVSITVSGYPAKYTNFQSPDKSYWTPMGVWLTQDAVRKAQSGSNGLNVLDVLPFMKDK